MIRIYDALGRIKEEIDPSQDNYCLHVSYVREQPPYTMVDDSLPWRGDQIMRRDEIVAKKRQDATGGEGEV